MRFSALLAAFHASATLAVAIGARSTDVGSATARLIFKAEKGSWFENVAVRSNGNLLVTRLDIPSVYELNPSTGAYSVVANFTDVTAALGIVEYAPDVFAVAVGNLSNTDFTSIPGSYSVQSLNFTNGNGAGGKVKPRLLARVPKATNLNGLTFRAPSSIYASDSFGFVVWEVDAVTRQVRIAVPENEAFKNDGAGMIPAGINGLKWDAARKQLYYTNSNKVTLGRIPFNGNAFAEPIQIASGMPGPTYFDDFDFDRSSGNFYIADGLNGTILISRDGSTQRFIDTTNALTLNGPTATRFGRGRNGNVLYITTGGRDAQQNRVGAQVAAYTFPSR